jgi:hypothetical protein
MAYPYTKFELNVCNPYRDNEWKLKISNFFFGSRGIALPKPADQNKFELDLRIPMTNLHNQFESYTCIQTKVREWKLKFISRGITLSKNNPTMTKFELDLHNKWKPFMEWRRVTLYAPGQFMAGAYICSFRPNQQGKK